MREAKRSRPLKEHPSYQATSSAGEGVATLLLRTCYGMAEAVLAR